MICSKDNDLWDQGMIVEMRYDPQQQMDYHWILYVLEMIKIDLNILQLLIIFGISMIPLHPI